MKGKKSSQKKSKDEIEVLKSQLVRVLADYDNLRKRVDLERQAWVKFSTERVFIKLLPVFDMLESAQEHIQDQGLAIVLGEFKKVLNEEGLVEIKPGKGDRFNPNAHEVVESIEGKETGKIVELVLVGWRYQDDKVVRPAKVKVVGEKLRRPAEKTK